MAKFKGGVHIDEKGYLRISAGKHRNKRVATLVAEAMLGRELLPTEDVHHLNEDKKDCDWRNLQVIDHTEHGYLSAAQGQFMKRKEAFEKGQWDEYVGDTDIQPSDRRSSRSAAQASRSAESSISSN